MKKYKINDVSKETGCTKRTIRYYVQRNLIPPPDYAGRGAYYNEHHIELIKIIKILRKEYLPLEKIKEKLDDNIFVKKVLAKGKKSVTGKAPDLLTRNRIVRVNLSPDIEINYKDYLPGTIKNKIEKIIKFSINILTEEGSNNNE